MSKVDELKNKAARKAQENGEKMRRTFSEFQDHPLLYIALIASGFLSALAGIAIGLGLRMVDGNVEIIADFPHIFFAILYACLFPYFFEFGLANWLHKLLHREPENTIQLVTAWIMVILTFVGTAITAYSAMDVLVTAGGFFASFTSISPTVQKWIAYALPTMFLLNIASGEAYRQFTAHAVLQRTADIELHEKRLGAELEVKLAQMEAKKNVAIAQADEYSRLAMAEAPQIGKDKGGGQWKHEAAQMRPAYNSETNAPQTQQEAQGAKEQARGDGNKSPNQNGR
jgi:hypothetical protein